MRLWDIFNAPIVPAPTSLYIRDSLGLWPIDEEYRLQGVREGWLVFDSFKMDDDIKLIYRLE